MTLLDERGERTITTFGPRLEPRGGEPALPLAQLREAAGVYFTAGDHDALRAARAARVPVASPRARGALVERGVPLDALVLSGRDESERAWAAPAAADAAMVALTEGERGGRYELAGGGVGRWAPAPPPAPPLDSYGCGDAFAAGLTYALATGLAGLDALALAARCGSVCVTGRGPYERLLDAAALRASES